MNQYQLELGQYNQDRTFNQSKLESDRNYALSAASAARAGGGGAAGSNAELKATADALKQTGGNWSQTAQILADKGMMSLPAQQSIMNLDEGTDLHLSRQQLPQK